MKQTINIGKAFSRYPAGRAAEDGPYSGESFRENFLVPALTTADAVEILLDDTAGYGSSFLEEVFGGLIRVGISSGVIKDKLTLVSEDASLVKEIWSYIDDAIRVRREQ